MEKFKFENMTVDRVIAHTILAAKEKKAVDPELYDELLPLDDDSKDLIQVRLTAALSSSSHGIEVDPIDVGENSFFQLSAQMINSDDAEFIVLSKRVAKKLAEVQINPRWPGGMLMLISGTVGGDSKRFVAALKAETDKGFNIEQVDKKIALKLIKKMLLSQTQRLYKVGVVVEIDAQPARPVEGYFAECYKFFLFDHLLTATETRPAAAYFYNSFLGMNIEGSSKHKTRMFYVESKAYIDGLPLAREEKNELKEALRAEMRSQKPMIQLKEFASEHVPESYRKEYVDQMKGKGFPEQAVFKDVEYVKHKLRRPRKVVFTTGVNIQVPANSEFKELVNINSFENGYTTVSIKGVVESEE